MKDEKQQQATGLAEQLWPVIVLFGSIGLLQYHAIIFWVEQIGSLGWAWPIMIEAVALWLWYQPKISLRALALVASVLALLGPVYEVSKPFIETVIYAEHNAEARVKRIEQLEEQRAILESNITTFRENSTQRTGWLTPIQQAEERLDTIQQELIKAYASAPADLGRWRDQWVIVMQALALVIFQLAAVISITTISKHNRERGGKRASGNKGNTGKPALETLETRTQAIDIKRETLGKVKPKPMERLPTPRQEKPTHSPASKESISVPTMEKPVQVTQGKDEGNEVGSVGNFALDEVLEIESNLNSALQEAAISRSAFGKKYQLSPRDLSFLRNHKMRSQTADRTISEEALVKIYDAYMDFIGS